MEEIRAATILPAIREDISFTTHEGAAITDALWDFFYRCYTLTYEAHHSTPYLTRSFFAEMATTMPQHWQGARPKC